MYLTGNHAFCGFCKQRNEGGCTRLHVGLVSRVTEGVCV